MDRKETLLLLLAMTVLYALLIVGVVTTFKAVL